MKHWPRLHDSYIARAVVGSVLLAWAVLLGLDVVLAFAGDVDDIGKGGYTINHAIAATGLTIPWRAYNLFPTAAVIGALMGLGQLAASSELTALRALGLSRRRLSVSVALSLAMLTAPRVVNGETLGPWGHERGQSPKTVRNKGMGVAQYQRLWGPGGHVFPPGPGRGGSGFGGRVSWTASAWALSSWGRWAGCSCSSWRRRPLWRSRRRGSSG